MRYTKCFFPSLCEALGSTLCTKGLGGGLQLAIYSMIISLLDSIWLIGDKAKDEWREVLKPSVFRSQLWPLRASCTSVWGLGLFSHYLRLIIPPAFIFDGSISKAYEALRLFLHPASVDWIPTEWQVLFSGAGSTVFNNKQTLWSLLSKETWGKSIIKMK